MSTPTPSDILEFVVGREIIARTQIDQWRDGATLPQSPLELTDELVNRGLLSGYQQSQILSGQGDKLVFGPYRIVKPLGEGGMGKVFKAWHSRLDRVVALKFILPDHLGQSDKVISRFFREARAIAQLHHPNVVILYDADEIDGTPYIAMEFVDGVSLWDMVIRGGPLGVRQACEYVRQTALGLQHAAECGLVHRDVKPSNILVARRRSAAPTQSKRPALVTVRDRERGAELAAGDDTVKILDMGLALLKDSLTDGRRKEATLTEMGAPLGTPDFISPEQARDARNVDIRSDLYSLGCTFYYILSGQVPFPSGNRVEKLLKHQLDLPTPITTLRPLLPPAVAGMVARLIEKNPEARFQTPQDLADALATFLGSPQPPTPAPTPEDRLGGTRMTLPSLALDSPREYEATKLAPSCDMTRPETHAPISSTPGIAAVAPGGHDPIAGRHATQEAIGKWPGSGSTVAEGNRSQRTLGHTGLVSAVALSGNGQFAVSADVNGQLRVTDLTGAVPREAASLRCPSEVQAVAFYPSDWSFVVYGMTVRGKAYLVRWDWTTNQTVEWGGVAVPEQAGVSCLGFSADGAAVAAGVGSQVVSWRFEKSTPTNQLIHKGHVTPVRALAISPDRVLLAASAHDETIRFWGLGRRDRKDGVPLQTHAASITALDFSPDGRWLALAGLDPRVVLWRVGDSDGHPPVALGGHTSNVAHVRFISDGGQLISVGVDGRVIYWDAPSAKPLRELTLDLKLAYRVAIAADGSRLVAGYSNGSVAFFDLAPCRPAASPEPTRRRPALHA